MIVPSTLIETSSAIAHLPSVDWASSHLLPTLSQALTNPPSSMVPTPISFVSTILLVAGSDMIPFLPCQPLAITLGATYGVWAYPMCVIGQTMAGVLAFRAARLALDSEKVLELLDNLGGEAQTKFQEFRKLGTAEEESQVLLALIVLRLAPFFPFSAGNYLMGAGTSVGLRPFLIATIFGCLLSNLLSVSVGIGGSELLQQQS